MILTQTSINAETRDRTGDLQIFSLTLSQLSYRGFGRLAKPWIGFLAGRRCEARELGACTVTSRSEMYVRLVQTCCWSWFIKLEADARAGSIAPQQTRHHHKSVVDLQCQLCAQAITVEVILCKYSRRALLVPAHRTHLMCVPYCAASCRTQREGRCNSCSSLCVCRDEFAALCVPPCEI